MTNKSETIKLDFKRAWDCITYSEHTKRYGLTDSRKDEFDIYAERVINNTGSGMEFDSISPDYLRIPHAQVRTEMISAIGELKSQNIDPSIDIVRSISDVVSSIRSSTLNRPTTNYVILFPLNVEESLNWPNEFSVNHYTIRKLSEQEWMQNYHSQYEKKRDNSSFIDKSPNQLYGSNGTLSSDFTVWKANYYARDSQYATNAISSMVNYLLAKINFSYYKTKIRSGYIGPEVFSARISELRAPYMYLCLHNSTIELFYENDFSLRDSVNVDWDADQNERFHQIPELSGATSGIGGELRKALQAYHSGIVSLSTHESFFDFWRGIEILTLTQRTESLSVVLDRALNVVKFQWSLPSEEVLSGVKEKRNKYVHEGSSVDISARDVIYTKALLDQLLTLCMRWYGQGYSKREARLLYEHASMNIEELSNKVELLDGILQSRKQS